MLGAMRGGVDRCVVVAALGVALLSCREKKPGPGVSETASPQGTSVASGPRAPGSAKELFVPQTTHGVLAGVLSWQDPALRPFSAEKRKDQELHDVLVRRGVPKGQLTLLLDKQATTAATLAAVRAAAPKVPPGGTFVFYYAGHGVRGKDGKVYFASYDMNSAQSATGLSMAALQNAITQGFRGSRVLLLADCCYSGGLAELAQALRDKHGIEALSLTSAEAANVSTGNWTYTQALIDGLTGDPLCDEDGNGEITTKELASEVRSAMLYREGQRYGYSALGDEGHLVARSQPADEATPKNRRRYVEVPRQRRTEVARVRTDAGGSLRVRLFHYATSQDIDVPNAQVEDIDFKRYPAGSKLRVTWEGKLWDAEVKRVDGAFHYITYPGWPSYWDEWVTSRRIVDPKAQAGFKVGQKVKIEWRGKWYPGFIQKTKGAQFLVRYDGYGSEWDEWVGPARLAAK